jgi:hypothetical protein
MRLTFSWQEQFGELEPVCESDTFNHDGVSLVSCLLMDTGGLPYLSTLPWIDEGLRLIEAVKCAEAESLEWGREDWGASLRCDGAKIYSLHDEDYADVMPLEPFEAALRAWKDFLQTPPNAKTTRTIFV